MIVMPIFIDVSGTTAFGWTVAVVVIIIIALLGFAWLVWKEMK
jgi:hypothetical protein